LNGKQCTRFQVAFTHEVLSNKVLIVDLDMKQVRIVRYMGAYDLALYILFLLVVFGDDDIGLVGAVL